MGDSSEQREKGRLAAPILIEEGVTSSLGELVNSTPPSDLMYKMR